MKKLMLLAILVSGNSATTFANDKLNDTWTFTFQQQTDFFVERCVNFPAGKVQFSFTKPATSVEFNIHYHFDGETKFPMKFTTSNAFSEMYTMEMAGEYCFMWQNTTDAPAAFPLSFSYKYQA